MTIVGALHPCLVVVLFVESWRKTTGEGRLGTKSWVTHIVNGWLFWLVDRIAVHSVSVQPFRVFL